MATVECSVITCGFCKHEYTDQDSISNKEVYTQEYFEEVHANWFANPHYDLFKEIDRLIYQHYRGQVAGLKIIDLGCGTGELLRYFSKDVSLSLTGTDICEKSSRFPRSASFIQGSIEELESRSKFDIVVSTLAIEHVSKPIVVMEKARELLKAGGLAIIVTNDVATPLYLASKCLRLVGLQQSYTRLYSPHHLNHLTQRSIRHLGNRAGLRHIHQAGIDIPLISLDIPGNTRLGRLTNQFAVRFLFFLGRLTKHQFLQIQIFEYDLLT